MFWKRSNKEEAKGTKLPGPRDIPEIARKYLASSQMIDPGILPFLKAVTKPSAQGEKITDIAIFDPSDAEAREVKVQNFDTLQSNPEMIVAQGQYNETDKKVEIVAKKAIPKVKLFTEAEILQQVEALKEPGTSVFFFMNAGTGVGGPLGRGAAVVRVNAPVAGKKVPRYAVYGASVVDMLPTKAETKIWDSDKAKDVAKWVANAQKPRFC